MLAPAIQPIVRRAILDLVLDIGGENNHAALATFLAELGHRVGGSDVRAEMKWLAGEGLLKVEEVGPYLVGRSTEDGRDVAAGRSQRDGVSRHKTGE